MIGTAAGVVLGLAIVGGAVAIVAIIVAVVGWALAGAP